MGGRCPQILGRVMTDIWKYNDGDVFHLLLTGDQACNVLGHWLDDGVPCDLRVRRSRKARGRYALETDNVMFASWVVRHSAGCGICIVRGGKVILNKECKETKQ